LNKCYLCDNEGDVICNKCLNEFKFIGKVSRFNYSFFEYNDIARKTLSLSKYPPYYFYLIKYLTLYGLKNFDQAYLNSIYYPIMCPVPLSFPKIFERGFNQSELICQTIEKELKIPYLNLLKRVRDTKPLFELNKEERKRELRNAFKTRYSLFLSHILGYKKVILVDDLITTSTTLSLCKREINKLGPKEVYFLTLFSKK